MNNSPKENNPQAEISAAEENVSHNESGSKLDGLKNEEIDGTTVLGGIGVKLGFDTSSSSGNNNYSGEALT
ncbi:MAG: hypothetical protein JNL57_11555 [Bacteroidetes bacterium]|nr:hypothetical protein [Bacteroidota bacterium]